MHLTTVFAILPLLALAAAAPTTDNSNHGKHAAENTCVYHEKNNEFHYHILGVDAIDKTSLETLTTDLKTCGGLKDIKHKSLNAKKHKHHWKIDANSPNQDADASCVADQLNKVLTKGNDGKKIECHKAKK